MFDDDLDGVVPPGLLESCDEVFGAHSVCDQLGDIRPKPCVCLQEFEGGSKVAASRGAEAQITEQDGLGQARSQVIEVRGGMEEDRSLRSNQRALSSFDGSNDFIDTLE